MAGFSKPIDERLKSSTSGRGICRGSSREDAVGSSDGDVVVFAVGSHAFPFGGISAKRDFPLHNFNFVCVMKKRKY